ncbi:MAG: substrate-binding domain-containing protein, partial [Xanthobacteraceae bacterium]
QTVRCLMRRTTVAGVILLAGFIQTAGADEIKMLASNAVRQAYTELVPVFEKATGHHVVVEWGGTSDIVRRATTGEAVDVVVIPAARVDALVAHGNAVERTDLARSSIGVASKADSPRPVVTTADDLRRALLTVRTIVLSSGPSGEYMRALFERLGVSGDIKEKVLQLAPGLSVGEAIAEGRGDLGFTQISELLAIKGIAYLGPLPADVQSVTVFSAGLLAPHVSSGATRALISFLAGPDATSVLRKHGLEPVRE